MDLGTVRQKLTAGEYRLPGDFRSDIDLIFNNARLYNARGSEVSESLESCTILMGQCFINCKYILAM